MVQTYFLGANSKQGFYSLYNRFPPDGAFLHIIKGGPGTGKSGFMRRIGEAAENRGYDVEYVLCSGDPDSLDGVYIPALRAAWVDGTAPHVGEPRSFAVDADYVNIGQFFNRPFSPEEKDYVNQLSHSYKALYARAYDYISAAATLRNASAPPAMSEKESADVRKKLLAALGKAPHIPSSDVPKEQKRFLRAASCLGNYMLTGEISELCKLIFSLNGEASQISAALNFVAEEAKTRGLDIILCPSPVDPNQLEALLIPGLSLAFTGFGDFETAQRIKVGGVLSKEARAELREAKKLYGKLMDLAYLKLRQAKALHDEMESVYKAHMDFPALTRFTDDEIARIFK